MKDKGIYVVDAHAHPPRKGVPGLDERPYIAPRTVEERDLYFNQDLDELIAEMDALHTDAKVMISMPPDIEHLFHFGEPHPESGLKTLTTLEWIMRAKQRYPKRFYGVACLNPLKSESADILEDLVKNHGFLGAKIHQAHDNFIANDTRVYPYYQKCLELGIPVAFHTGFPPDRDIDRYIPTMPHALDEVARDFPKLKIIMCHAGANWYQDGVMIAMRNPNITVDISSIPNTCRRMVYPVVDDKVLIKRIVGLLGADRVMYGTDNFDAEMNLAYMQGIGLSDSELRMVMGETAIKTFQLD